MFKPLPLLIVVSLLLSGCSVVSMKPDVEGVNKTLQQRVAFLNEAPCCTKVSEMKAEPLTEKNIFSMEENRDIAEIGDIKSYYKLFEIPESSGETSYLLKSYLLDGDNETTQNLLFLPRIFILDSEFNVVRNSNFRLFDYEWWSIKSDPNFYIYIKIDKEAIPDQKYLLITSSQIPYGETVNFSSNYDSSYNNMIGNRAYTINDPQTEDVSFMTSPSGALTIESIGFMSTPGDAYYLF